MRRYPPLNHLRAFEAAGRLGSFKAAASELNVSDAAVSQHIRSLESLIGTPLFFRTYEGVTLTSAGKDYLPALTEALDLIANASSQLLRSNLTGVLRISVVPSLGSRWLLPRLEQFSRAYPDICVDPSMTSTIVRLGNGEADIAIRHGNGNWKDAASTLLRNEFLIPVASSELIGAKILRSARDVLNYPLLAATARKAEWPHWFLCQGVNTPQTQRFVTYDTIALAIDAAISGIGISLVDKALVADDLRQGRLKVVIDAPVSGVGAYYVAVPKGRTSDRKTIAFKDWLISEASRDTE